MHVSWLERNAAAGQRDADSPNRLVAKSKDDLEKFMAVMVMVYDWLAIILDGACDLKLTAQDICTIPM